MAVTDRPTVVCPRCGAPYVIALWPVADPSICPLCRVFARSEQRLVDRDQPRSGDVFLAEFGIPHE